MCEAKSDDEKTLSKNRKAIVQPCDNCCAMTIGNPPSLQVYSCFSSRTLSFPFPLARLLPFILNERIRHRLTDAQETPAVERSR
jgi:hypothetical protein